MNKLKQNIALLLVVCGSCLSVNAQLPGQDDSLFHAGDLIARRNIVFPYNSTVLPVDCYPFLDSIGAILKTHPDLVIEVGVHTDTRMSAHYSRCLTCGRAEAIGDYLIKSGISPGQVRCTGYNDRQPLISPKEIDALKDKQEQEKAHQINRRVEFKVISKRPSDD
jgi:outer membrane protein OmpA-like peptidoglycan-associated protein